jgi:hypothetical protein
MNTIKRLYSRADSWLRGLSRVPYAFVLGTSAGGGVLVVGLLLSKEFVFVEAITMALVTFGLECVFGLHQTAEG